MLLSPIGNNCQHQNILELLLDNINHYSLLTLLPYIFLRVLDIIPNVK
jgi:hypothetical protein